MVPIIVIAGLALVGMGLALDAKTVPQSKPNEPPTPAPTGEPPTPEVPEPAPPPT